MLVVQKHVSPEISKTCRTCRHYNQGDSKSNDFRKIPDHVKQVPSTEHVITRLKPKIIRQEIIHEKPACAPIQSNCERPTEIYARKSEALEIDSL